MLHQEIEGPLFHSVQENRRLFTILSKIAVRTVVVAKSLFKLKNKGNKYMKTGANDSVLQIEQRNILREIKVKVGGQK